MIYQYFIFPFLIALQFLTKIPIHLKQLPTPQQNAHSSLYYPIVGLLIGSILYLIAIYVPAPVLIKSIIILFAWLWLTGGLHLDGLADSIDGFVGGYGDTQRTLAIMKDPHIGAMGVIAIVFAILGKFASILSLFSLPQQALIALLFAPILARLNILALLLSTPYIRPAGLGSHLSQYLPKKAVIVVSIITLSTLFILPFSLAILILCVWFTQVIFLRRWFIQRIGGITGDTLGASVEISEMILLLCCVMYFYH